MTNSSHTDDFIRRAVAAHRRRDRTNNMLESTFEEIDGRDFVIVRDRGAAVAAYKVQRNRLRKASHIPESVW